MAKANIPRWNGDDYQARFFWLQASKLFSPHTNVEKVIFEADNPKSFDDVAIIFNGKEKDAEGRIIAARYYQTKFHTHPSGPYNWQALITPDFINAEKISLLQRLFQAWSKHTTDHSHFQYVFVTNWPVDSKDPLNELVSNTAIDVVKLKQTKFAPIRKAWIKVLGLISEETLFQMLDFFRIETQQIGSLAGDNLNVHLQAAGLKPVIPGTLVHPYDDLAKKILCVRKSSTFTKDDLHKVCEQAGLWIGTPEVPPELFRVGIKSFIRGTENLEKEVDKALSLLEYFNGRAIKDGRMWDSDIYPAVRKFVEDTIQDNSRIYELQLPVHVSIAFAVGFLLDVKCGKDIRFLQLHPAGRSLWQFTDSNVSQKENAFSVTWNKNSGYDSSSKTTDVALAISISRSTLGDVQIYAANHMPQVERILHLIPGNGSGNSVIKDAAHATRLVYQIAELLKNELTDAERSGRLHIFLSTPNGFTFFLGRVARGFGQCVLYEYDFDANKPGAYQRSISIPG